MIMRFTGTHRAALATALLAAAVPLWAQSADSVVIDPQWRPYFGCWHTSSAGSVGPTTCIVPTTSAHTIEMLALANDSIIARTTITASPTRVQQDRDGCRGWETGNWSGNTRRLFTRAEFTCEGSSTQVSSGIFAMSDPDAFSRIEGVTTPSGTRIRVINYVRLAAAVLPPRDAARLQRTEGLPAIAARADAAAPITLTDVAAAVKQVDSTV
ncbi:MAG TPA: hypothetical protein VE861_16470, partial [Gemmatimonadaceae bacterium]|nr:hypothetical protein [Gemmatimonadaceae bacterium]